MGGKRIWLYPTKPSGRFYRARTWVSWFLLALMFAGPWIRIHGNPILQMNIPERRFYIFGTLFLPQDFYILAIAGITAFVSLVLFTAVFGRVWCGWLCPQTVMMEMVFRKIEYFIEGDGPMQRLLNLAPWTPGKLAKKVIKQVVFFALSFLVGNLLLAYIIGPEALGKIITDPIGSHVGGLTAMILFSLLFYGIFARFREQACIFICPYGRFQSVLLDENSLVVAYDYKRGEGRAKFNPKLTVEDRKLKGLGDCVDCGRCVAVCPTGIDIRNGTPQLECVNCTACIDACDFMMDKVKRPRGLVRFASRSNIENGTRFTLTGRLKAYVALLCVLLTGLFTLLLTRDPVEATLLRAPGMTYQKLREGHYSNLYTVKLFNKTTRPLDATFELQEPAGGHLTVAGQQTLTVPPASPYQSVLILDLPEKQAGLNVPVSVRLMSGGQVVHVLKTNFIGPGEEHHDKD
ncbi:MAG: cytochrome c oxidase accessory protein CcoG [Kiritimatiellia bacterium]